MFFQILGYCFGAGILVLMLGAIIFKVAAEIRHNKRAKETRKRIQIATENGDNGF